MNIKRIYKPVLFCLLPVILLLFQSCSKKETLENRLRRQRRSRCRQQHRFQCVRLAGIDHLTYFLLIHHGGTPDDETFPLRYEVDYVRVYRKE
ncbi:MAG: hypothetical protein LBK94_11125 [Prevotellaceae bacterium]|nr:hypothetical protein [Prevotellaceae bacterium]